MQTKIIYAVLFLIAFVLTTGGVVVLNEKYENIFKLDFSPRRTALDGSKFGFLNSSKMPGGPAAIDTSRLKREWENKIKREVMDSLVSIKDKKKYDAIIAERNRQLDSLNNIKRAIALYEEQLKNKTSELQSVKSEQKIRQDSAYVRWKKEMVKTYELMDSRMAAKIIQKLNDNLAKDILFSMKKKKRAQIIAEFSPDTAIRLTRM